MNRSIAPVQGRGGSTYFLMYETMIEAELSHPNYWTDVFIQFYFQYTFGVFLINDILCRTKHATHVNEFIYLNHFKAIIFITCILK